MQSPRPQKVDQKGRSIGTKKSGPAKNWNPETPFIAHSKALRESYAFRMLTSPARKILDFIELEHLSHGGRENGRLAAPYRQLVAFGMSKRDVPKSLRMLEICGLIRRTDDGGCMGGRMNMARYRLTYFPDSTGNLPTDEWKKVEQGQIVTFLKDPKRYAS